MNGDNESSNCAVPIESINSWVKTQYRENESEAVNITPNRNRSDNSRHVVLTPPKTDTPREYESTYVFEDSMTEDLDISPVLDKTFSLDSDDGDEEEDDGNEILETSFTISKPRKNDLGVDNVGKAISQVCVIEEDEEEEDDDEDYTSDFININMNNADGENVFNLSIIYEENSFDLNCSGGFDDN